jgi:hypothetical protein
MVIMFLDEPGESRRDAVSGWGQQSGGIMVLLLAALVIFFGVYPQPLIALVHAAGMAHG